MLLKRTDGFGLLEKLGLEVDVLVGHELLERVGLAVEDLDCCELLEKVELADEVGVKEELRVAMELRELE
jgi:hypothetical protein